MANDLNSCMFIGRLGRDPESRTVGSGDAVVNFSIACGWKTKSNEGTEWINVVAFGKLAEICQQYLSKGSQVFIAGRMQTRKWQDKDGATRHSTEIVADRMQMLGPRPDGQRQEPRQNARQEQYSAPADDFDDDSIPF